MWPEVFGNCGRGEVLCVEACCMSEANEDSHLDCGRLLADSDWVLARSGGGTSDSGQTSQLIFSDSDGACVHSPIEH